VGQSDADSDLPHVVRNLARGANRNRVGCPVNAGRHSSLCGVLTTGGRLHREHQTGVCGVGDEIAGNRRLYAVVSARLARDDLRPRRAPGGVIADEGDARAFEGMFRCAPLPSDGSVHSAEDPAPRTGLAI
jgi:hypothetical protein